MPSSSKGVHRLAVVAFFAAPVLVYLVLVLGSGKEPQILAVGLPLVAVVAASSVYAVRWVVRGFREDREEK
jgi:hypothetical protein